MDMSHSIGTNTWPCLLLLSTLLAQMGLSMLGFHSLKCLVVIKMRFTDMVSYVHGRNILTQKQHSITSPISQMEKKKKTDREIKLLPKIT